MNDSLDTLLKHTCEQLSDHDSTLSLSDIEKYRNLTPNWQYCATENVLCRTFHFDNYQDTIAFVNQVAKVADEQNHHPDMIVSYQRCKVNYSTHSIGGISINDFVCAAHIDLFNA